MEYGVVYESVSTNLKKFNKMTIYLQEDFMKSKTIKGNSGASIIFVLILLAILSVLGTSLYAYSMQSIDVMKWGFDSARAKLLARGGVEQAAYAYQSAAKKAYEAKDETDEALQFVSTAERKFTIVKDDAENKVVMKEISENGDIGETWENGKEDSEKTITTNWMFACVYDKNKDSSKYGKTPRIIYLDGGDEEQPDRSKVANRKVIGYYKVTVTNTPKLIHIYAKCDEHNNKHCTDKNHYRIENYKTFNCTAYVNGKSGTSKASLVINEVAGPETTWTDKNGVMLFPAIAMKNMGILDESGGTINPSDIKADSRISEMGESSFTFPTKFGISMGSVKFKVYGAGTTGNLILKLPTKNNENGKTETLKFPNFSQHDNYSHYQSNSIFSGQSLFIKGGIDTEPYPIGKNIPDNSHLPWYLEKIADAANQIMDYANKISNQWNGKAPNVNTLYLSGNDIVIEGDIDLYAYYFPSNWFSNIANSTIGNVRLGTVVLNIPDKSGSIKDPMPKAKGGVPDTVGKVYFGGDVKIHILQSDLHGGNKIFTLFKAGTVCYFAGGKTFKAGTGVTNSNNISITGIDLLKYFLDTAIKDNEKTNKYSLDMIKKFKEINDAYYYTSNKTSEFLYYDMLYSGCNVSMRKIDPQKNSKYDRITDTIPPSEYANTYLVWE